jgi:hypothetical protein
MWIRDPGMEKIRIRDKHPGSATLLLYYKINLNIIVICCIISATYFIWEANLLGTGI